MSAEYKGLGEATSEDNAKKFSKNELERFRTGLNLKDHDFQDGRGRKQKTSPHISSGARTRLFPMMRATGLDLHGSLQ